MREIIARDKPFTKETWDREKTKQVFRDKGESFKVELVDAIPGNEPIKIYHQGDWFDLCRGPHMTSTGKVGSAFKLMKVAGAYWRGDSQQPDAHPHLRHRVRQAGGARRLSQAARGSREARPPQARPRARPVPLPGGRPGRRVLARQGLVAVPVDHRLHAPPPRRRLRRGERAADARQVAVGDLRPLGLVPREHVRRAVGGRRGRGQALVRHQADELPRPCADLQAWAEELSRPADPPRRIRRGASLRAVRRAARAVARARLHPGRRAHLLHRGAARRRVPEDQRPDPLGLCGLRLHQRHPDQARDPAGEARRHRRDVGSRRGRAAKPCSTGSRRSPAGASRPASIRAKAPSTGRSSNTCCAMRSAATGNAAPRRSTSTCRSGSARSTSMRTARRSSP